MLLYWCKCCCIHLFPPWTPAPYPSIPALTKFQIPIRGKLSISTSVGVQNLYYRSPILGPKNTFQKFQKTNPPKVPLLMSIGQKWYSPPLVSQYLKCPSLDYERKCEERGCWSNFWDFQSWSGGKKWEKSEYVQFVQFAVRWIFLVEHPSPSMFCPI